jgi:hypothetical protein
MFMGKGILGRKNLGFSGGKSSPRSENPVGETAGPTAKTKHNNSFVITS